jgi:FAD/FMN-containing dehydrogenase
MTLERPTGATGLDRRGFLRGVGVTLALAGWSAWPTAAAGAGRSRPLAALAAQLRGAVITSASPAYAQARLVYNERFDGVYPLAVVQPASRTDVQTTLRWARERGVALAVRSGGHSYGGYSTGTGLVLDLGRFGGISFDRRTAIVTVGAGARLIDVEAALAAHGQAIPTGSCATVGIGGLAQGGGVGFASRMFGTTSDNVVSFGIVDAAGRYRLCDAHHNEDLYWACRGGGGGNFGVVTHFALQTHPVGPVSYFFASWPWSQASAVIEAWQSFAPHAPDELFSLCSLQTSTSEPVVQVFGQFLGSQPRLERAIAPLGEVAGQTLSIGSSAYLDAQLRWAGCLGKTVAQCHIVGETPQASLERSLFDAKSDYIARPLTSAGRAVIVDWIERAQGGGFGSGSLLLDSYGGALNRPAPTETAFVHRDALGSAQYLTYFGPGREAEALAWIEAFYAAMRPYVSGYAYQNYIDRDLADWSHAYYGENYPRLQAIKRQVDPENFFHFAQSIRPS